MRYGYYLAHDKALLGDAQLARLARVTWRRTGHKAPGRYDGVSIVEGEDGRTAVLLTCRDLFTNSSLPKVFVFRG